MKSSKSNSLSSKHKFFLFFAKIGWRIKGREKMVSRSQLERLFKETEERYNDNYRKNPTHHETLKLEGSLKTLNTLLND